MKRKPKPLHQQAREKGLTENDSRELMLYREFLKQPVRNEAAYRRVYGAKGRT